MTQPESGPRGEAWRLARKTRDWLAQRRAWAPFEPLGLWLGPRVLPGTARETMATIPGALSMVLPPDFPPAQSYHEGSYEPELTQWFLRTIRPGWTVVDAGANVGYYTLLASLAVGATGRVFAFEPDPANFEYLQRNLKMNNCTNVHAEQIALSDSSGLFPFRRDRFRAEGHLVEKLRSSRGTIPVESVPLDEFFERHGLPAIQVIKLDIEGGEPKALLGAAGTVSRSPELHVVLERNPRALRRSGTRESDLRSILLSLGFRRGRWVEGSEPMFPLDAYARFAGHTQNLEVWR